MLAPIGVSAYNIQETTIHAALHIPIQEYHPLTWHSLLMFQERCKHLFYILIDEMSFLGPQLLIKVDNRLRQAFPTRHHEPFAGLSVVLVGNLGQLPPIMEKPLYASHSTMLTLWHSFTDVITLDVSFRQQGLSPSQIQFRKILLNVHNTTPVQSD